MPDLPPEVVFENAINDAIARYAKLKKLTASIVVRRDEAQAELERGRQRLGEITSELDAALDADQDDEALALMQEQEDAQGRVNAQLLELEQAQTDADEAKLSVVQLRDSIQDLKADRDRTLVKLQSVSLREQIDSFSVDAELVALENVRDHIKTTLAEVELNRELGDADYDARIRKLRDKDSETSLKEQLEELKKARAEARESAGPGMAPPGKRRM